jgi:hypothetical protein
MTDAAAFFIAAFVVAAFGGPLWISIVLGVLALGCAIAQMD